MSDPIASALPIVACKFCTACGQELPPRSRYCPVCGSALGPVPAGDSDPDPVTLVAFFPCLLDAFEDVAIKDFFRTLAAARLVLLRPFEYEAMRRDGRLPRLYTMLLMATFAGTFKLYNDPVYGPWMKRLDFGDELVHAAVMVAVYMTLSTGFGVLALLAARGVHAVLRLPVERERFVRAMMTVFILIAFVADLLSPFWNLPVRRGAVFWGYFDLIRAAVTLLYAYLVYLGLRQGEPFSEAQPSQ